MKMVQVIIGTYVMSLEKAIKSGKEKRKPHRKAKSIDSSCRNHGRCPWCEGNRTFQERKEQHSAKERETIDYE